jgi:hypothetical protein
MQAHGQHLKPQIRKQMSLGTYSRSRFRHYFCSNLYRCAPRGSRGVKKSEFFLQIKLLSFCDNFA